MFYIRKTWSGHPDCLSLLWLSTVLSTSRLLKPLYQQNIMLWDTLHFENCVYSVKLCRVKGKKKEKNKLSKLSTEPAYTQSRNHHAELLRNIENTSFSGKHYALHCWITLHFNVQICSLTFCWKDQTIWHFVWDINALRRCSIIY